MLMQRFRAYFTRSIVPRRRNGALRADVLRDRLDEAERRVGYCGRLVAGWQELVAIDQAAGRDVTAARDVLRSFQTDLEVAMTDKAEAEKDQAKMLLDLFEGANGRLPKTDKELNEWLASPAGQAATLFAPASLDRWGNVGRS